MRIFILRNSSFNENAGLKRLYYSLSESHDLHFITRDRVSNEKKKVITSLFDENNYNTIINLNAGFGKGIKNIFTLSKYVFTLSFLLIKKRNEIDYIHSFDLDTGLASLVVYKLFNKKYNYHIADYYVESRPRIPKLIKRFIESLEQTVINNAETTIICTEERRVQIKNTRPKELLVVHNAPTLLSCPISKSKSAKLNLCYIGTLNQNRFLIELVNVVRDNPVLNLTIGGYGSIESEIKNEVKEIDNIDFIGKVKYEETFKYYASSDLMVAVYNPMIENHKFSAPNKVYEAMALSKPIIVAKGTGIDEIVDREDMGYVIDYKQEDFIDIINNIILNKDNLSHKANNSGRAYEKYSWFEMKKKIINLYGT